MCTQVNICDSANAVITIVTPLEYLTGSCRSLGQAATTWHHPLLGASLCPRPRVPGTVQVYTARRVPSRGRIVSQGTFCGD